MNRRQRYHTVLVLDPVLRFDFYLTIPPKSAYHLAPRILQDLVQLKSHDSDRSLRERFFQTLPKFLKSSDHLFQRCMMSWQSPGPEQLIHAEVSSLTFSALSHH